MMERYRLYLAKRAFAIFLVHFQNKQALAPNKAVLHNMALKTVEVPFK